MQREFDFNHLFIFQLENAQARRRFSVGALLMLASFIIPILPYLPLMGYTMKIMRQVIQGQKPTMPDWDDWETLSKDGLKLFGIRFIYALPILIIMLPVFGLFILAPIFISSENEALAVLTMFAPFAAMLCMMPFFVFAGLIIPVAEAHVAANNNFSAGFRIHEWWNIFRKNIGGFVIAYLIIYGVTMLISLVYQMLIFTIILLCLMPVITPIFSFYLQIIYYALIARAYRDGQLNHTAALEAVQE